MTTVKSRIDDTRFPCAVLDTSTKSEGSPWNPVVALVMHCANEEIASSYLCDPLAGTTEKSPLAETAESHALGSCVHHTLGGL